MTLGGDVASRSSPSGGSGPPDDVLVRARGLSKAFFGVTVLDGVDLNLRRGEIHALIGENGAGKSTLINLLSGIHRPGSGELHLDGRAVGFSAPGDAQRLGITTIHQEFGLFPDLTVAETIFAGHLPVTRFRLVDWKGIARRADAVLRRLGVAIAGARRIAELSVAEQQLVEIARALTLESRLIIMDEPTASLTPEEVRHLETVVRSVAAEGAAILFVSHRLEEVKKLAGRYTVLRDGRMVANGLVKDVSVDDLVRFMVGRNVDLKRHADGKAGPGEVVLEVEALSGRADAGRAVVVQDVGFAVRAGEIVGLAGLVGAGRTEIARLIFGADPVGSGVIRLHGRPFRPGGPADAIKAGIALVPEDRKQQALFLELAASENFAMTGSERPGPLGLLRRNAERKAFRALRERLNLRSARPDLPVAALSGGNQQKVVLARWLALKPRLLIVDEPTRGVDIGAKADLHRLLRELAETGVAILLISSDLPEILALSDRILTLRAGRLTGEVAGADADEATLMRLMTLPPLAA